MNNTVQDRRTRTASIGLATALLCGLSLHLGDRLDSGSGEREATVSLGDRDARDARWDTQYVMKINSFYMADQGHYAASPAELDRWSAQHGLSRGNDSPSRSRLVWYVTQGESKTEAAGYTVRIRAGQTICTAGAAEGQERVECDQAAPGW
jgi:hypothetical protein